MSTAIPNAATCRRLNRDSHRPLKCNKSNEINGDKIFYGETLGTEAGFFLLTLSETRDWLNQQLKTQDAFKAFALTQQTAAVKRPIIMPMHKIDAYLSKHEVDWNDDQDGIGNDIWTVSGEELSQMTLLQLQARLVWILVRNVAPNEDESLLADESDGTRQPKWHPYCYGSDRKKFHIWALLKAWKKDATAAKPRNKRSAIVTSKKLPQAKLREHQGEAIDALSEFRRDKNFDPSALAKRGEAGSASDDDENEDETRDNGRGEGTERAKFVSVNGSWWMDKDTIPTASDINSNSFTNNAFMQALRDASNGNFPSSCKIKSIARCRASDRQEPLNSTEDLSESLEESGNVSFRITFDKTYEPLGNVGVPKDREDLDADADEVNDQLTQLMVWVDKNLNDFVEFKQTLQRVMANGNMATNEEQVKIEEMWLQLSTAALEEMDMDTTME